VSSWTLLIRAQAPISIRAGWVIVGGEAHVRNASFWLDLRIALHTLIFIFTGERRFEQAVRDANTQQRNGHYKPQIIANRAEPREISTARSQPPARLPINARARATPQRRAQVD